jgi:hypothetical protein
MVEGLESNLSKFVNNSKNNMLEAYQNYIFYF